MTPYRDLTDHEWHCVVPLLPEMQPRTELRGDRWPTRAPS